MAAESVSEEKFRGHRPRCSLCSEPAVIRLRNPDRHLGAEHFSLDLTGRVRQTVISHQLISDGDRIAAAFSGGKDSTALLLLLKEIIPAWRDVSLVAITIDEGIGGYRDETIRAAKRLANDLKIEHRIVAFHDMFGKDLDTILAGREERACSFCGILRRKALSSAARDAVATRIATGHNLDDEAQSVLMNVLRGDLSRLLRTSSSSSGDCFLPRIKPLMAISEKEIAVYLAVCGRFPDLPECPYTWYALRAEIRSRLSAFELRYPGTMHNLVAGNERLKKELAGVPCSEDISRCVECGEPCSGTVCQTCRLIQKLLG